MPSPRFVGAALVLLGFATVVFRKQLAALEGATTPAEGAVGARRRSRAGMVQVVVGVLFLVKAVLDFSGIPGRPGAALGPRLMLAATSLVASVVFIWLGLRLRRGPEVLSRRGSSIAVTVLGLVIAAGGAFVFFAGSAI